MMAEATVTGAPGCNDKESATTMTVIALHIAIRVAIPRPGILARIVMVGQAGHCVDAAAQLQ